MNFAVKYPLALAAVLLWAGFLGAISFMEAWLKFRAPGITTPLGLGIGRIVFNALNKMEWLFTLLIALNFLLARADFDRWQLLLFCIPVVLLLVQTFWLLPALDARAQMHIEEKTVPPSSLHFYYVAMEGIKLISLCLLAFNLLRK